MKPEQAKKKEKLAEALKRNLERRKLTKELAHPEFISGSREIPNQVRDVRSKTDSK